MGIRLEDGAVSLRVEVLMQQMFPGEVFANTADFDTGIRQLLPRYDEMLSVICTCLPSASDRILELGCGTGELSLKILNRCPNAQVIAVDYSPRMLEFAQKKMTTAGYQHRWTGIEADFGEWANHPEQFDIGLEFDACVSSLAIHHLKDEMKSKLFSRIRESLIGGGCFWNADPVLPESLILTEVYTVVREEWAAQQGKTLAEIRAKTAKTTTQGYSSQDQLATLDTHVQMLKKAGFETVAVPWKYYGLAVFGGWTHRV
jgi:tRNA (cmo5U34)-methyltransferase